jgi:hypothetical protein
MSDTVTNAYALKPENISVVTGSFWFFWNTTTSLVDLFDIILIDCDLRNDFMSRINALNTKEKSVTLNQAILEARFWQNEFVMARAIQAIGEQIFTDRVRENWEAKTPEERIALMERFMNESMAVMFADMPINRTGELVFDASGNGVMRRNEGGAVGIDQIGFNPDFRDLATGNHSVDAMIRVMVHEVRHAYQWEIREWARQPESERGPNPFPHVPDSVMTDWGRDYIEHNRLTGRDNNFMEYYLQPVEVDANAFAGLARPRDVLEGG